MVDFFLIWKRGDGFLFLIGSFDVFIFLIIVFCVLWVSKGIGVISFNYGIVIVIDFDDVEELEMFFEVFLLCLIELI